MKPYYKLLMTVFLVIGTYVSAQDVNGVWDIPWGATEDFAMGVMLQKGCTFTKSEDRSYVIAIEHIDTYKGAFLQLLSTIEVNFYKGKFCQFWIEFDTPIVSLYEHLVEVLKTKYGETIDIEDIPLLKRILGGWRKPK